MLMVEIDDCAEGDYSPDYGTIESIKKSTDGKVFTVTYKNGTTQTLKSGDEILVNQGGRFDR